LFVAALGMAVTLVTAGASTGAADGEPPLAGISDWQHDSLAARTVPDVSTASPATVAAGFARLSADERHELAVRHPRVVGNLDGVPLGVRYAANRVAVAAAYQEARARATEHDMTGRQRTIARQEAAHYQSLLGGDSHVLAFDPRGAGRIAVVLGDARRAQRLAVVVPGAGVDAAHFYDPQAPLAMARNLLAQARAQRPHTRLAVIAWLGYTAPHDVWPDAAENDLAQAGAPPLVRFVDGLRATSSARIALLCHSYGSVVCGLAAPRLPAAVTDIAVFGSPGMDAPNVAALRTRARVWAGRERSDWIQNVPFVQIAGLGHGSDPVSPGFGARVFATTGGSGHAGYLGSQDTEAIRNLARIAQGEDASVTCAGSPHCTGPSI
jgi:hypothetical protein